MLADIAVHAAGATAQEAAGPGGHRGNDSESSATGSQPQHRLFGQATPGPANQQPKPATPTGVLTQKGAMSVRPDSGYLFH